MSCCAEHHLPGSDKWQFWVISYECIENHYEIEPIISTKTVESFCRYFWILPKPSEIRKGRMRVSLALFRNDIKPAWEDPRNKDGACYYIMVNKGKSLDTNKERKGTPEYEVDEIWLELLFQIIGGTIDDILKDQNKLQGVVIMPKTENKYCIQVWMEKYEAMGQVRDVTELRKLLEAHWSKGNSDAKVTPESVKFLPHSRE